MFLDKKECFDPKVTFFIKHTLPFSDLNKIDIFTDDGCLLFRDQIMFYFKEVMWLFTNLAGKEQMVLGHGIVLSIGQHTLFSLHRTGEIYLLL